MSLLNQPEFRRLLRDSAWVLGLLVLLWSPLPELVLGHWLQISNDARPETGRAHDRLDLLQESDSQAVGRSAVVEKERIETASILSLAHLRRGLANRGEVELPLGNFRQIMAGLSSWQRNEIISDDDLRQLDQRGLASVQVTGQGSRARIAFLDVSHNRLSGVEVDLLRLEILPLELSELASGDTVQVTGDDAVYELADQGAEVVLDQANRDLLKRLRAITGLQVRRVWQSQGRIQLVEIRAAGQRQWLRPPTSLSRGDTTAPLEVEP